MKEILANLEVDFLIMYDLVKSNIKDFSVQNIDWKLKNFWTHTWIPNLSLKSDYQFFKNHIINSINPFSISLVLKLKKTYKNDQTR